MIRHPVLTSFNDFIGLDLESDPLPDFSWTLELLSSVPATTDFSLIDPRTNSELFRLAADNTTSFRKIVSANGLTPLLVELAIIDDDSIEMAESRHRSRNTRFVSHVAAYCGRKVSAVLLDAWHRAISKLTDQASPWNISIVGHPSTYCHGMCVLPIVSPGHGGSALPLPGSSTTVADGSLYARQYRFSYDTASSPPHSDETHRKIVCEAVRELCDFFIERISVLHADKRLCRSEFDAVYEQLCRSVLLLLPFHRPEIGMQRTLHSRSNFGPDERRAGCVFLVCIPDPGLASDEEQLTLRLERVAHQSQWVVQRSALHESRLCRAREADMTNIVHGLQTAQGVLTQQIINLHRATSAPGGVPAQDLASQLDVMHASAERLMRLCSASVHSWKVRSGDEQPKQLGRMLDAREFVGQLSQTLQEELVRCCRLLDIELQLDQAWAVSTIGDWHSSGRVCFSDEYIDLVTSEVLRNALRYGDRESESFLEASLLVADKTVLLQVANVSTSAVIKEAKRVIQQGTFRLGLAQLVHAARAWARMSIPEFTVNEDENKFLVRVSVGELS